MLLGTITRKSPAVIWHHVTAPSTLIPLFYCLDGTVHLVLHLDHQGYLGVDLSSWVSSEHLCSFWLQELESLRTASVQQYPRNCLPTFSLRVPLTQNHKKTRQQARLQSYKTNTWSTINLWICDPSKIPASAFSLLKPGNVLQTGFCGAGTRRNGVFTLLWVWNAFPPLFHVFFCSAMEVNTSLNTDLKMTL